MTRKLEIPVLALLAVIALGALGTSRAWATNHPFHFESGSEHTIIKGQQHAGTTELITEIGKVTCASVTYTGTMSMKTAAELTLTPSFSGCKAFGSLNATIDVNGCHFLFIAGTLQTTSGGNYEGATHFFCPTGKRIEVTAPGCTLTVITQSPLGTTTFTQVGSGSTREITVDMALSGITYEEHKSGLFSTCASPTAVRTNGLFVGKALLTGETTSGQHAELSNEVGESEHVAETAHQAKTAHEVQTEAHAEETAHEAQTAHEAETKAHEEETKAHEAETDEHEEETAHEAETEEHEEETANPVLVHSELDHTTLTGSSADPSAFAFGALFGGIECEEAALKGTISATSVPSLTLEPAYSGCSYQEEDEVTVATNGCAYVLTPTGKSQDARLDIECPAEEAIETTIDGFLGGCTITVGPQTGAGVVDHDGEGAGGTRDLLLTWTLVGVEYERDGCGGGGEGDDGTYAGSITLKGENALQEQAGVWIE